MKSSLSNYVTMAKMHRHMSLFLCKILCTFAGCIGIFAIFGTRQKKTPQFARVRAARGWEWVYQASSVDLPHQSHTLDPALNASGASPPLRSYYKLRIQRSEVHIANRGNWLVALKIQICKWYCQRTYEVKTRFYHICVQCTCILQVAPFYLKWNMFWAKHTRQYYTFVSSFKMDSYI